MASGEDFPDAEDALLELLEDIALTVTATNEDLEELMPVIAVERTGGAPNRQGWEDHAVVEVTCFARTRPESKALNAQVFSRLNAARQVQTSVGLIDKITASIAPRQVPYENLDVRMVPSTWDVVSRMQELP
jgi:hypothetical protein